MSDEAVENYNEWDSKLCGCFGDSATCLLGYFCPCVLFGQNALKMGQVDHCAKGKVIQHH